MPSPQSKSSLVSKPGIPGHFAGGGVTTRARLLLTTRLSEIVTEDALVTRMPSKLVLSGHHHLAEGAEGRFGVAAVDVDAVPLAGRVMVVLALLAPISDSDLPITTS